MTHTPIDPYNGDHTEASRLTMNARVYAQAMGYPSPHKHLGAPPVFYFEPHQTEMCQFKPDVILDITPVFETKVKAMHCMDAQTHLWNYYTDVAKRRGTQGGRNSGNPRSFTRRRSNASTRRSSRTHSNEMKHRIVRNIARADAEVIETLGRQGVATFTKRRAARG